MVLSRRVANWSRAGFNIMKRNLPLAKAAYQGYKMYKRSSNGAPRKSVRTNTVSFQHDYSSQYSRKRAPRRVRRRAIRQTRTFNHQLGKQSSQYSRLFNHIYAPTTVTPTSLSNSQTVFNVGLYGGEPSSASAMDTWYQVCNDAGALVDTRRILCKSAVLNVQIQNEDDTAPLVVDAYRYVARREGYDEPGLEWSQALINQASAAGSTNDLTTLSLDCTPFDAPGFGSKYLITGKTKYRIAPGNSVYLQMRDPRNYGFETARFDYDAANTTPRVHIFKGMTKGWIFVARSANTDATNSFGGVVNWKVIQSQSYHYAFLSANGDVQGQN